MAELAEEYSDGILHITTRQDVQLHYVHIDDTPDLMRRLAAVGITTREACGNSVRNVTALPARGRLPHRGVRRHALRGRALPLPARPPGLPGLRAQVQDRLLRLRRRGLRARDDARLRRHRPHARWWTGRSAALRALRRRRPRHHAAPGEAALRGRPGGGAAARGPGHRPRLRPPRREAEPQPRPHQVPGRQARHRRVPAAGGRGARRSCPTTTAGPPTSPGSSASTRARRASPCP